MWTDERQKEFGDRVCEDLPQQFRAQLLASLADLLALRCKPMHWLPKSIKATTLMMKSGTIKPVWKIYNCYSGGKMDWSFSYGDRFIRFAGLTLFFAHWIVFFGGEDLAKRIIVGLQKDIKPDPV